MSNSGAASGRPSHCITIKTSSSAPASIPEPECMPVPKHTHHLESTADARRRCLRKHQLLSASFAAAKGSDKGKKSSQNGAGVTPQQDTAQPARRHQGFLRNKKCHTFLPLGVVVSPLPPRSCPPPRTKFLKLFFFREFSSVSFVSGKVFL